jgi:hypothetical protein
VLWASEQLHVVASGLWIELSLCQCIPNLCRDTQIAKRRNVTDQGGRRISDQLSERIFILRTAKLVQLAMQMRKASSDEAMGWADLVKPMYGNMGVTKR